MKKLLTFLVLWFLALNVAAIYGILHDQFTYTISHEYYTKFKFIQFELVEETQEAIFESPRIQVCVVGIMATWWMGIPIGFALALVGLLNRNWRDMLFTTLKAFGILVIVAFITGLVGLGYGFYQAEHNLQSFTQDWYLPTNLIDVKNFVAVGSMHNFSYIGGVLGAVVAVIYSVHNRK